MEQETKQSKSAVNTPKKQRGKPFTKDDPRINKEGRPLGSKNFATDFDEVVEEIAKLNNITTSEARKILLRKAYSEAKNGNYNFYKDTCDRYYGKAHDVFEGDPDKPLIIQISQEIASKNDVSNQPPINNS